MWADILYWIGFGLLAAIFVTGRGWRGGRPRWWHPHAFLLVAVLSCWRSLEVSISLLVLGVMLWLVRRLYPVVLRTPEDP